MQRDALQGEGDMFPPGFIILVALLIFGPPLWASLSVSTTSIFWILTAAFLGWVGCLILAYLIYQAVESMLRAGRVARKKLFPALPHDYSSWPK